MLLLAKKAMKKPVQFVMPPQPTQPEPPKPPELLPEPRVEPDPTPEPKVEFPREPFVPFAATPEPIVVQMLKLASVQKNDVLYDLGSGDGRIVITAAQKFGARAFGYEIDPSLVRKSREEIQKQKLENLAVVEERNMYRLDLSRGSVITLYLSPEANLKLVPQLQKMQPGSRVVSYKYRIEGYKPLVTHKVWTQEKGTMREHTIWLYTIPLEKE